MLQDKICKYLLVAISTLLKWPQARDNESLSMMLSGFCFQKSLSRLSCPRILDEDKGKLYGQRFSISRVRNTTGWEQLTFPGIQGQLWTQNILPRSSNTKGSDINRNKTVHYRMLIPFTPIQTESDTLKNSIKY